MPLKSGQRSIVPNYVIGLHYLLPDRPLAGKHGLNHGRFEPPGGQPRSLSAGCGRHNDQSVEFGCGPGFEEQGDIGEEVPAEVKALGAQCHPALADDGMNDGFQPVPRGGVGED